MQTHRIAAEPTEHRAQTRAEFTLLGGFEVRVDDALVSVPRGNAATLLKLLVLRRGMVSVDEAVASIWPCSEFRRGRARLRNVLARTNAALGAPDCTSGMIQRDGDLFVLSNQVTYDVDFLTAIDGGTGLLRAPTPTVEAMAAAVATLSNQLLPSDAHESWLEDHQAHRVRLLVLLARRQLEVASDAGLITIARPGRERCLELVAAPPRMVTEALRPDERHPAIHLERAPLEQAV